MRVPDCMVVAAVLQRCEADPSPQRVSEVVQEVSAETGLDVEVVLSVLVRAQQDAGLTAGWIGW